MAKRKEETMKHSLSKKKKKSKRIPKDGVDASGAGELLGISNGNIKKKRKNKHDRSKTRKSKRIGEKMKEDGLIDQLEEKTGILAGRDCEVPIMQDEAIATQRILREPKKLNKNKGKKAHVMPKEEDKMHDKKLKKKERKGSDGTKESANMQGKKQKKKEQKGNGATVEGADTQGKKHKEKKAEEDNKCEEKGSLEDKKVEADFDDVLHMSSGDEDCSKGMKKWITEYHQRIPGLEVLCQRTDEFLIHHDNKLEEEREEREARAAEGGWTVVAHQKGRKKNVETETGTTVGSVSQAVVEEYLSKKKPKELKDFYRFQKREAQRNEILTLQSKFEQDRKRIQQLRAARKFRPY